MEEILGDLERVKHMAHQLIASRALEQFWVAKEVEEEGLEGYTAFLDIREWQGSTLLSQTHGVRFVETRKEAKPGWGVCALHTLSRTLKVFPEGFFLMQCQLSAWTQTGTVNRYKKNNLSSYIFSIPIQQCSGIGTNNSLNLELTVPFNNKSCITSCYSEWNSRS